MYYETEDQAKLKNKDFPLPSFEIISTRNSFLEEHEQFYLDPNEDLSAISELLPELSQIEYMIFQLSDGDILKKKQIEENFGVLDFLKWNLYKAYEAGLEEVMRQALQTKTND